MTPRYGGKVIRLASQIFPHPFPYFYSSVPQWSIFLPSDHSSQIRIVRVLTGLLAGRGVLNNDADRVFFSIYSLG